MGEAGGQESGFGHVHQGTWKSAGHPWWLEQQEWRSLRECIIFQGVGKASPKGTISDFGGEPGHSRGLQSKAVTERKQSSGRSQDRMPNTARWRVEYFKLKEFDKPAKVGRLIWPPLSLSPETGHKTLMWEGPFLYWKKGAPLSLKAKGHREES